MMSYEMLLKRKEEQLKNLKLCKDCIHCYADGDFPYESFCLRNHCFYEEVFGRDLGLEDARLCYEEREDLDKCGMDAKFMEK